MQIRYGNLCLVITGLGIATLLVGLVVRSLVSATVTLGTGFNRKERLFIVLTWVSKATVQVRRRDETFK